MLAGGRQNHCQGRVRGFVVVAWSGSWGVLCAYSALVDIQFAQPPNACGSCLGPSNSICIPRQTDRQTM